MPVFRSLGLISFLFVGTVSVAIAQARVGENVGDTPTHAILVELK